MGRADHNVYPAHIHLYLFFAAAKRNVFMVQSRIEDSVYYHTVRDNHVHHCDSKHVSEQKDLTGHKNTAFSVDTACSRRFGHMSDKQIFLI